MIFGDPVKYADKFVRNPDGSLNHVITTTQNLGTLSAAGVDISLAFRLPKTAWGNFGINLDGTYTSKYQQQLEPRTVSEPAGRLVSERAAAGAALEAQPGVQLGAGAVERDSGAELLVIPVLAAVRSRAN